MLAHDLARALDPSLLMADAGQTPDTWQQDVLRSESKRLLLLCSRQSGKSTVAAALALHTALYQAPALALLLSPSLRQSQELFRKVLDVYRVIGETIPTEQESALRLELSNGSRIIALPGLETTIRGFSGAKLLVIDEAARVDDGLYYSVRPMLAVSGGRLVCLTTPAGKRGFFHHEWTEGSGWEKVMVRADQCPRITATFLEEERRSMPANWFASEYLCQFSDAVDQVFSHEHVMAALSDEVEPLFASSPLLDHSVLDRHVSPLGGLQ